MHNNSIYWKFSVTIITILFISIISAGCSAGYRLLTIDEGIAHFSFEYPADLNEVDISRYNLDIYVSAYLIRSVVKDGWWDKSLFVAAEKPPVLGYEDAHDAGTFLVEYINKLKDDFKIVQVRERTPVTIGGIQGEQVVYSYDERSMRMPLPDAPLKGHPGGSSLIWINRAIFFDHDGLVWFIRMSSIEEEAEKTKLDFEQFIDTFEILD